MCVNLRIDTTELEITDQVISNQSLQNLTKLSIVNLKVAQTDQLPDHKLINPDPEVDQVIRKLIR
jgi:hypothetical protein